MVVLKGEEGVSWKIGEEAIIYYCIGRNTNTAMKS